MKKIGLPALLVALATPAGAFNENELQAAFNICRDAGTNMHICGMKHAPSEGAARDAAKAVLEWCASGIEGNAYAVKDCADTRAYIKQRWGY